MTAARRLGPVVVGVALLSAAPSILGGLARAGTTALSPTEDFFVSEAGEDRDAGDLRQLRVDGDPVKVAYLTFDVPPGVADAASLEIYAHHEHDGVDVAIGAAPGEPGGVASPELTPAASTGPISGGDWVAVDVSGLVGEGATTFALTTTSGEGAVFSSMEGRFAPRLVVGAPVVTELPTTTPSPVPSEPVPTPTPSDPAPTPTPTAAPGSGAAIWAVETAPVRGSGDVADDPAIWVNSADSSQSLVIGANKDNSTGGLHVYDLAGNELQYVGSGKMNNVDVRYGLAFGGGIADIVAATNRTQDTIDFFRVASQRLEPVGSVQAGIGVYGSCMYLSASGELYAYATSEAGEVEQYRVDTGGSTVTATEVRAFDVGGATEGCVADDDTGDLYLAEERVGIWRYGAAPDAGTTRTPVDSVSSGHLRADVEGLTIFYGPGGSGFLIASSQGDSTFAVYDRATNVYIASFAITGPGDDVTATDGIDITSTPLGTAFPAGLLVVHDASNEGTSNFKYVAWTEIVTAVGLGGAPGATPTPGVSASPGTARISTNVVSCPRPDGC
jgi:3-phytase